MRTTTGTIRAIFVFLCLFIAFPRLQVFAQDPSPTPFDFSHWNLFTDDFESQTDSKWSKVSGSWSVVTDETGNWVWFQSNDASGSHAYIPGTGPVNWTDYIFEAEVKLLTYGGDSTHPGLHFGSVRSPNASAQYRYQNLPDIFQETVKLLRQMDTTFTLLTSIPAVFGHNVWRTWRMDARGHEINVYVDGENLISWNDGTGPVRGTIRIGTDRATAYFDNIRVRSWPSPTPTSYYCNTPMALNDITDASIGTVRSAFNYGYKYQIYAVDETGDANRWFYLYDRLNTFTDGTAVPDSYLKLGIYPDADYGVQEGDWVNLTGLDWSNQTVNLYFYPPVTELPLDTWTYYYIAADGSLYNDELLCELAESAPTPVVYPTPAPTATPPPAVHFVSQTGGNVFPYTSWTDAAWEVESAFSACWESGTVMVYPDTYYVGCLNFRTSMTITGSDPSNRPVFCLDENIGGGSEGWAWLFVRGPYNVNVSNLILDAGGDGKRLQYGIWCRDGASGTIENNVVQNIWPADWYGIGILAWEDILIRNNLIRNIERAGIVARRNTTFNCRIQNNIVIGKNNPDRLDAGIQVDTGGDASIEGNTVYYCTGRPYGWSSVGIYVNSPLWSEYGQSGISILDNDVFENAVGIYVGSSTSGDFSEMSGTGNSIRDNLWGVYQESGKTVVTDGNIFDNVYYGVRNDSPVTADATYNWWGHQSGPYHPDLNPDGSGNRVSNNVDFQPYRSQPYPATPTPEGYRSPSPTPTPDNYPSPSPTSSATAAPTPEPTLTPVGYLSPTPWVPDPDKYFVDGSGAPADDSFDGQYPEWLGGLNGPWETINHAVSQLQPGDTCFVRSAIYEEEVNAMANPGTALNRITVYGDSSGQFWPDSLERPVISGSYYVRDYCLESRQDYWSYHNLEARYGRLAGFSSAFSRAAGNQFINCLSQMNQTGFFSDFRNGHTVFEDCIAIDNNVNGFKVSNHDHQDQPVILRRCRAEGNWVGLYLTLPHTGGIPSPLGIESSLFARNSFAGVKAADPGSWSDLTMVNTTISDNGYYGFHIGDFGDQTDHNTWIYNSIITGNRQAEGVTHYGIFDDSGQVLETDYNCVTDNENDYGGQAAAGPNSIADDPLYLDRDEGNYRIRYTSPARAAGSGIWSPQTDLDGNLFDDPPSMGAFEAASQPTPTPSVAPSPTAAPTSTATPSPTASPAPTATAIPSLSSTPSPTVTPEVAPTAPHLVVDWDDYDGDGTSDIAVYEPGTGEWRINEVTSGLIWGGGAGDIPAPGDYDGDGAADVGYFDRFSGEWHILSLTGGVLFDGERWGDVDDVPVPGDYDGNGTADLAVFRPSTNRWLVRNVTIALWGVPGDIPVPGDYTGNGTTDIAMLRPSSGIWFVRWIQERVWWRDGDTAVPMDYDGDGTTDLAVYRPSIGRWFIRHLSGSISYTINWGAPSFGDIPAVGDFDGDGSADPTAFRPINNRWWIRYSGQPYNYLPFPAQTTDFFVTGATSY